MPMPIQGAQIMKQGIALRAALTVGAAAGVVAISACSPTSSGAPATAQPTPPTSTTAQAPANQANAPGAQVTSATGPAHIYFPLCGAGSASVRSKIEPTVITFSCDSTLSVVDAHWTTWNSDHAEATAVLEENDCTPSCADDVLARNKVTVRFDKPVRESCGEFWSEAVFTYLGKPVGVVHSHSPWTFNPVQSGTYC
jgi:hypothetical protein